MTLSRVIVLWAGGDKWQACVKVDKEDVPGNVLKCPWRAAADAVWRARLVVEAKKENANEA